MYYKYLLLIITIILLSSTKSIAQNELVIVQITDTQLGFYPDDENLKHDIDNYTEAVRRINEIKPDVVVITGDFVNSAKDANQLKEFNRITSLIDKNIPIYLSPGNHDINIPAAEDDFNFYFTQYGKGKDRFSIKKENIALIGFNSVIIKSDKNSKEENKQYDWLKKQLRKAQKCDKIVLFTHYPFFINDYNEEVTYSNQSAETRDKYFQLFVEQNVDAIFSGHLHDNAEASYNDILMITTNAVGRSLGKAKTGMRIITISKDKLEYNFISLNK